MTPEWLSSNAQTSRLRLVRVDLKAGGSIVDIRAWGQWCDSEGRHGKCKNPMGPANFVLECQRGLVIQ